MIDQEITLTCTDNGKKIQGHILNFKNKAYIDVAVNTVKIKLIYNKNGVYAGNMGPYEFTIKESLLPLQK